MAADIKTLTDEELLRAYKQTSGEPGDPITETILAKIKRRGLAI